MSTQYKRQRLHTGHIARMPEFVPAKAILSTACDVRDGGDTV